MVLENAIAGNQCLSCSMLSVPSSNFNDISLLQMTVVSMDQKPVNNRFSGAKAVDGLDNLDQLIAGTGSYQNTQTTTRPPDGALCVGAGYVIQAVNLALTVFDYSSNQLISPVALNQFFKRSPELIMSTGANGDFLSDPQCIFDHDTGRFFLNILYVTVDPITGYDGTYDRGTGTLIAVSQTADPLGGWHLYVQPTINDGSGGTPNVSPLCPCLGDQPYIAADAYSLTTSVNLFGSTGYAGPMVYVASKQALAAGATSVLTAAFLPEQLVVPGTDSLTTVPVGQSSSLWTTHTRLATVAYSILSRASIRIVTAPKADWLFTPL